MLDMIRFRLFTLAAAVMLATSPGVSPEAQAQAQEQRPLRVELDQTLLDRWIAVAPGFFRMSKTLSLSSPDLETVVRQQTEKMCAEAGFDSLDQCHQVFAYVGMFIENCDGSGIFRDPIPLFRRRLARLEMDTKLPPAERDHTIVQLKLLLALFPDRLPAEHVRLLNANRGRIFAAFQPGLAEPN
jgi:hypothetical protein